MTYDKVTIHRSHSPPTLVYDADACMVFCPFTHNKEITVLSFIYLLKKNLALIKTYVKYPYQQPAFLKHKRDLTLVKLNEILH